MTAIEITRDDVRNGLRALVDAAGEDFVYARKPSSTGGGCLYVHKGKADCIVGQFLAAKGVPLDRLAEADEFRHGGGQPARYLLESLREEGMIKAELGVVVALDEAQSIQDAGDSWGDALRGAQSELNYWEARIVESGQD